ncbi:MAG: hypothetical protein O2820_10290 [Planctomycetota bacterium]|nr:hypothetical protein [Planctomycetota bacterium]
MVTGTDLTRPRTIEGITRPDPRHHYGQILSWVICWPWNLLWTFAVHNPLRYICQFALHEIQSTLDEIATGEFSEITRDLEERAPLRGHPSAPQPNSEPATWTPHVSTNEASSIETVNEATFVTVPGASAPGASAVPSRPVERSAVETLEKSPSWASLLSATPPATADLSGSYSPPALPPTHEPDPWYYAPGGRPHEPQTPESN